MGMSDELVAPFEPVTDAAAAALLGERYGIPDAAVSRLDSERDDTFHVSSEYGEFVFKVAHPADDPLLVNLQTSAMAFASDVDPEIPLQRVLPSLEGEIEAILSTDAGERVMRVLTWLPGAPLRETRPTREQLFELGAMLGRLTSALEDFRHPASVRPLAWSVEQLPSLRPMLEFSPQLAPAFERFVNLSDAIAELPHQVVHNDASLDNVLVGVVSAGSISASSISASSVTGFVSGIIDFGDTLYTARAIDLAVAASYLIDPDVGLASIEALVEGYRSRAALLPVELELLPELIRGRLLQRMIIPAYLSATTADASYANRINALTAAQWASLDD
jgi:hydroxylysine kinase